MERGRKPKPPALKVIAGTDQPCRMGGAAAALPEVKDETAPPDWLTQADAVAEWARVEPMLRASRVLTEGDLTALAHLCQLHGACVKLYRAGLEPTAAQLTQLRTFYAEFGLTPSSRSRVSSGGPKDDGNPFGRNGRRPGA